MQAKATTKTREVTVHIGVDVPAYRAQVFHVDVALKGDALIEKLKELVVESEEQSECEFPADSIEWEFRGGLRIIAADDEASEEIVGENIDIETNHVEIGMALVEANRGGDIEGTRIRLLEVLKYAGYDDGVARAILGIGAV